MDRIEYKVRKKLRSDAILVAEVILYHLSLLIEDMMSSLQIKRIGVTLMKIHSGEEALI